MKFSTPSVSSKKPTLPRFFAAFVLLASVATLAQSEPLSALQTITLEDAVARALAGHPTLRAQGAAITAAEQSAKIDALPPPLVIGSEVENFAGSGDLRGVNGVETTLRLSQVIELGGKRDARMALGRAEVDRQRHSAERARIDVAAQTARRFIEVLTAQYRLALAGEELTRREQTRKHVARWVEAGRSPDSDGHQADIALGGARLALEDAEHELEAARLSLAALWGERGSSFSHGSGDLNNLPAVEDFTTLAARLPQSMDQQVFSKEATSLEARRQAVTAAARSDISLSVGVRHMESIGDQALVFGVSAPLGSTRRSALGVGRYDAELEAVAAQRESAELDAYQRLFGLYQELQHSRHVVEAHRDTLIPKAEQALAVTSRGYELGRFNFMALNQSQQQLTELRTASVEAAARYHLLLVDIERLTATTGAATP